MKKRIRILALVLVMATVLTLMPAMSMNVSATTNYSGGMAVMGSSSEPVRSNPSSSASVIGTVYAFETFTVLSDSQVGWYWIEYSTSSGAKRGYISSANCRGSTATSRLGQVKSTATLYYGPSTSTYMASGTVYSGEFVSILRVGEDVDWAYVEYNTTQGRKRGYMRYSNLTDYDDWKTVDGLYTSGTNEWNDTAKSVYAGPCSTYPVVGSIGSENITVCGAASYDGTFYKYIIYTVDGTSQKKSGWIVA